MRVLESPFHKLHIAYGLTLVTPTLRGCKAFPTPGPLAHTRITWALSPTAPQVSGVTPRFPLCPRYFKHSSWRGALHSPPPNEVDALINYTHSLDTNLKLHPLWCGILFTLGCDPHNASSKFGIVPKVSFPGGYLGSLVQRPNLH